MAQIVYLETVTAPFAVYGADIHGLEWASVGPSLWAVAGYGSGRIAEFDISTNASFLGDSLLGSGNDGFVSANYGGQVANLSATLTGEIAAGAPGALQDGWTIYDLNTGYAADRVTLAAVDTGSALYLVSTVPGNGDGLVSFARANDGTLSLVGALTDPTLGPIADLATVTAYGETWIIAATPTIDAVQSYTIDAAGQLTHQAGFGAAEGLGINNPTALAPFLIGGQPYLLLASADTNSLSVLRLEGDGSFSATDHVLDDLETRFANPVVVEVVQSGQSTFAIAAGSDDGFSLFRILGDGTLSLLGSYADDAQLALDNVEAAAMRVDSGTLHLLTASATEIGLGHFAVDISGLGDEVSGSAGADNLIGTALGDVILAGGGDDIVDGGAGDDLIRDGAGSDVLTGGAGSDIFVFTEDGVADTITDFERGVDALDLSFYALLHDMSDVGYVQKSWGAILTVKGETLDIHSSDGNALGLADMTANDPFPVDRPPLVLSPGGSGTAGAYVVIGTGADDVLVGSRIDDVITGNGGDDVLMGGLGADQLLGGPGFDIASYANATGPVAVNLGNPAANSGDAAGDTYALIEGVEGSGYADTLTGTSIGELFLGGAGDDLIDSGGGDDRLEGGPGDDWLMGGSGADALDGGTGSDWADYSLGGAVRADLANATRNTGDAAGDSYLSVENLAGGIGNDALYGDGGANQLDGGGGNDRLFGGGGADILNGGSGDDVLLGGDGADQLIGGSGTDRADYSDAKAGLTASLANSSLNTGAATGDIFSGIEDLAGSQFADVLSGSGADNFLFGLDGNDDLDGAGGNDTLIGGRGDDRLTGGIGNDDLMGGLGADTFVFAPGMGADRVSDFTDGTDILAFDTALLGSTPATVDDLIADHVTDLGGDLLISFGVDTVLLEGIADANSLFGDVVFF